MAMLVTAVWDLATTAGGAFAFGFIVALALGIGALTLFFFGSSVVVLQGFARRARFGLPLAAVVVLWSLVLGGILGSRAELREFYPDDWTPLRIVAVNELGALIVTTVLVLASGLALRALRPGLLARASLLLLGAGYGLAVAGTARAAYALAPAAACALAAAVAAGWRRRSRSPAGEVEQGLWLLAAALAAAGLPVLALDGPSPTLARVGASILQIFLLVVVFGLIPLAAAGLVASRHTPEWFIAARYLVAKRRQTFISIISLICALGVAAGVWLIITVLSVMNGFQHVWRDEFVGKRAHLTVLSREGPFDGWERTLHSVLEDREVIGAAPFLDAEGMVRGDRGQIQGVRIRGVDPERVGQVSTLLDDVVVGSLSDLEAPAQGDGENLPGIAIGSQLAFSLGAGVGDPILVVSPFGGPPTPFGPAPRLHRYRIAAVFQSSFFGYDELVAYVSLRSAQEFLRLPDVVHGIEVRVRDVYRSRRVGDELQSRLGNPFYARDWKEVFPAFFQALKTERAMMFVLLTMIMVVAAFVIVATLIMMIMEKASDIAILKAMGASDDVIERIFAIEGTLIGLAGTAVGVVAGIVVTKRLPWIQEQVEELTGIDTLPATVYQGISTLPSDIDPAQVAVVAAIAMVLALGATLLPSRQGARIDPAEALRYE